MVMRSVTPSFFAQVVSKLQAKSWTIRNSISVFFYREAHFLYNQPDTAKLHRNFVDEITIRIVGVSCGLFFKKFAGLTTRHTLTTLSPTYQLQQISVANFFAQEALSVAINTPTLIKSPLCTDEVTFMST